MPSVNDFCAGCPEHADPVDNFQKDGHRCQKVLLETVKDDITNASPHTTTARSYPTKEFAASLASLAVDTGTEATTMQRFLEEGAREQASLLALSEEVAGLNISRPRIPNANVTSCESTNPHVKCLEWYVLLHLMPLSRANCYSRDETDIYLQVLGGGWINEGRCRSNSMKLKEIVIESSRITCKTLSS